MLNKINSDDYISQRIGAQKVKLKLPPIESTTKKKKKWKRKKGRITKSRSSPTIHEDGLKTDEDTSIINIVTSELFTEKEGGSYIQKELPTEILKEESPREKDIVETQISVSKEKKKVKKKENSTSKCIHNKRKEKNEAIKSFLYSTTYAIVIFSTGFIYSSLGQSIQLFVETTNSTISDLSYSFTFRTIGTVISGILSALLCSWSDKFHSSKKIKAIKPRWLRELLLFIFSAPFFMIVSMFITIIYAFVIPFITSFIVVNILNFFVGFGFLNTYVIGNYMISKFASTKSKTIYLQLTGITNGLGSLCAPFFIGIILDLEVSSSTKLLIIYLSSGNFCLLVCFITFFCMDNNFIYQKNKSGSSVEDQNTKEDKKPNSEKELIEEKPSNEEKELKFIGKESKTEKENSSNSGFVQVEKKQKRLDRIGNYILAVLGGLVGLSFGAVISCFLDTGFTYILNRKYLNEFNASLYVTTYSAAGLASRILVIFLNLENPLFQLRTTGMFIIFQIISMFLLFLFSMFSFFFVHISILWIIVGTLGFFYSPLTGFLLTCLVEMQFQLSASQVSFVLSGIALGFITPTFIIYFMENFGDDAYVWSLIITSLFSSFCIFIYFLAIYVVKGRKVFFKNAFITFTKK